MSADHGRPGPAPSDLHADARPYFLSTMGFESDLDAHVAWGTATIGPYLRVPGSDWPVVSALLTFADVLIGRLASQRTAPRISVTADLGVRVLVPLAPDESLDMRATLLKVGRSMSVGETEFRSATSGELVATSLGSFLASPRPTDEVPDGFPALDSLLSPVVSQTATTLAEQVGLRVLDAGVAEIAGLRPDLSNATQSLQGGLTALLGEVAAQSAASAAAQAPQVVETLDVHYLAAARRGPFRATARVLSLETDRAALRVEVRDGGHENRLAAVINAGTRPAPTWSGVGAT